MAEDSNHDPQPEFSVMLYGQQYDFYTVKNFARLIKRSVSKLNHMSNHPARMKDEGRRRKVRHPARQPERHQRVF